MINSILQMKKPRLEGPHYWLKTEVLLSDWPRLADLRPLALSNTWPQPQFLPPHSWWMQLKNACKALYLGHNFLSQNWCSAVFCFLNIYSANPLTKPQDLLYSKKSRSQSPLWKRFTAAISYTPIPDGDSQQQLPISFTLGGCQLCVAKGTFLSPAVS